MTKRETAELLRCRYEAAWDAYTTAKAEFMAYKDEHFPGNLLLDSEHEMAIIDRLTRAEHSGGGV